MFNDQQRPTDKLNPLSGGDKAGKAKDNVVQLTDMMERGEIKTDFARLGWDTDAQYDKGTSNCSGGSPPTNSDVILTPC
jgi:hypothetical protein